MIFTNILLAYQLENYYNLRFLKFIYSHPKFWIYGSKRQSIEYTSKAKLILFLAIIILICDILGSIWLLDGVMVLLSLIVIALLLPVYYVIASFIIFPLDSFLKNRIVRAATNKMQKHKNLTVIAITWSYGKTTTKEILHTILSESFHVLSTEGTKNTPLWISKVINEKLSDTHEIFIVEMWAYSKWNIAELCSIVWPNISIITGITLQHLERFKSLDNIIDAKFEILESLWKDDFAVVDSSSQGVQKWLATKNLAVQNIFKIEQNIPMQYLDNLSGIEFDFQWEKIKTKLLADYIGKTLQICYAVSQKLWQDISQFRAGVSKIDFVEHRMQLIHNPSNNVYILDDSFNGNLEGVNSIISLLEKAPFTGKKILVAWGIVELGDKLESENKLLWEKFSHVCDLVLLVEWPVWNAIESGLKSQNYPAEKIKKYTGALELHADIKNILTSWDLIIFQNDLPDHYL